MPAREGPRERTEEEKLEPAEGGKHRPYIGILFRCCQVYQRIYRSPRGDRYAGFCPRCLRRVEVMISADGTEERLFEAE